MVTREQRVRAIAKHLFEESGQERMVGEWEEITLAHSNVRQSYIEEAEAIVDADPLTKEVGQGS